MQLAARRSPPRLDHIPVGVVSVVSMLVLGVLAGGLVVDLIPRLLTVESSCITSQGWTRSDGDAYFDTVMVVGTFGWLGIAVATIYASIADRRRVVLLLPPAWFVVFVLLALTMAAVVGPAPCAG